MRLLRVFAAAAALASLLACQQSAPNDRAAPEAAFTAFVGALGSGSPEAIWSFLDEPTRALLEARASDAREAGADVAHPASLIVAGWVPDAADIDEVSRVEETDEAVRLRVDTVHGHSAEIVMHRGDDGWRVALPIPDAT